MFRGNLSFLSNFFKCNIVFCGKKYPSSEHLYQAMKMKNNSDAKLIRKQPTPSKAKYYGKHKELRKNFEGIKTYIMFIVVYEKFKQNKHLMEKLSSVENKNLVEYNYWHDNFWGDCTCERCKKTKGQNNLGKILKIIKKLNQSK